ERLRQEYLYRGREEPDPGDRERTDERAALRRPRIPRELTHEPNAAEDPSSRPDREESTEDQQPPAFAVRGRDGLRDRGREGRGHAGLTGEVGWVVPREIDDQTESAHQEQDQRDQPQEALVGGAAREQAPRTSPVALERLDHEPHRRMPLARALELRLGTLLRSEERRVGKEG